MPELAEVEFYRRCWDPGLGQRVLRVELHSEKRIFRQVSPTELRQCVTGAILKESVARGKQLLFSFSRHLWLGVHLGMSGKLRVERADFEPGKHDHLALFQRGRALVFSDPRLFGLIRFHRGSEPPAWWTGLPASLLSPEFTRQSVGEFLQRHARLPIKAALLLQAGFPGIGNWMADEILWRARLDPRRLARELSPAERARLWGQVRHVSKEALRHVGEDFSDPPRGWLFHERWGGGGRCPIHRDILQRQTIGGRSTAWCAVCQR